MEKQWIIGIDEVGRGPLAGPVTVAAVAASISNLQFSMNQFSNLAGIRDSKKLSLLQREKWRLVIYKNFICSLSSVSSRVIDKKGIVYATRTAVARCLKKLEVKHKIQNTRYQILLDGGLSAPSQYKNQKTIIKGDERVPIIAAASIVAKVHRDRYMIRLHKRFPAYEFDKHKGYGTRLHCAMLKKHGLSPTHRTSFCRFV